MAPSFTPKNHAQRTAKKIIAVSVVALIGAGAFMRHAAPNVPAVAKPSVGLSPTMPAASPTAEEAVFASLKAGMSYQQVIAILGSTGEETVSNELSGVKTVLYEWKDDKAWATKNAVFQDNKLISMKLFAMK